MSSFSMTVGEIRRLSDEEELMYPGFKYCTMSECRYEDEQYTIVVPKGFLTDGSSKAPDYGYSWLFHDYLYASHRFTSGQECTREMADEIMNNILIHERQTIYSTIFYHLAYWDILGIFERAWENSGKRGVKLFEFFDEEDVVVEDSIDDEEYE